MVVYLSDAEHCDNASKKFECHAEAGAVALTTYSKATSVFKLLTGAVWFLLGVAITVSVYPSFTREYPSEIIKVQVTNSTNDIVRASFFMSDGDTVGSVVPAGVQKEIVLFEGELSSSEPPISVHVLMAGEGTELIFNMEFEISKSNNDFVTAPASFEIMNPSEGDTEKRVKFVIRGGTNQ